MRKQIALQVFIFNLVLDNFQKDLCRVEVEDDQEHLGHVQFRFQVLSVVLVTFDVEVDSHLGILEDLFFVDSQQVKGDVVGIRFNSVCKEPNFKFDIPLVNELKRKTELLSQNQNLQNFIVLDEFGVRLEELEDVVVRKHDITFFVAFVRDQYRHEVQQTAGRVLVFVHLFIFYAHQLVPNIASYVQIALQLKDVRDHFVVVSF